MYPAPIVVDFDGRTLTVEDAGQADGFPVLVHSGGGCRHLEPAGVREAHRHGLRLISYDRPSYGGSTPLPGRSVADCKPDIEAVLGELGISRIAVWGFSGGGPYALATAALLPDVVAAVCVLAPLGPYGAPGLDFLEDMDESYHEEVHMFFKDRAAARETFREQCADMYGRLSTPEDWLRIWGDRAGTDAAHSQEAAEFLASGFTGWVDPWR